MPSGKAENNIGVSQLGIPFPAPMERHGRKSIVAVAASAVLSAPSTHFASWRFCGALPGAEAAQASLQVVH